MHDDKSSADSQSKATGLGLSMYQSVLDSKPVLQYKMGPFIKPMIKKKNRDLVNVTHGTSFKHQNSAISPNVVTEYLRQNSTTETADDADDPRRQTTLKAVPQYTELREQVNERTNEDTMTAGVLEMSPSQTSAN